MQYSVEQVEGELAKKPNSYTTLPRDQLETAIANIENMRVSLDRRYSMLVPTVPADWEESARINRVDAQLARRYDFLCGLIKDRYAEEQRAASGENQPVLVTFFDLKLRILHIRGQLYDFEREYRINIRTGNHNPEHTMRAGELSRELGDLEVKLERAQDELNKRSKIATAA